MVIYWSLMDFLNVALGTRSNVSKYKIDCIDQKQTWLVMHTSESMGKGKR